MYQVLNDAAAQLASSVEAAKARLAATLALLAAEEAQAKASRTARHADLQKHFNQLDNRVVTARAATLGLSVGDRTMQIAAMLQAQTYRI